MSEEPPEHGAPPRNKPSQIRVRTYLVSVGLIVVLSFGAPAVEKILRPTSEKVCTTKNVVISHENRSRTSYKLDTSCGQLVVDDSIAEEADRTIKTDTTYRMVIASGPLAEYLMKLPVEAQPSRGY